MEVKYKDDKKKKADSHEIHLREDLWGSLVLYRIEVSLDCFEESKEDVIIEFETKRKVLSSELRRLADEIDSFDLSIL